LATLNLRDLDEAGQRAALSPYQISDRGLRKIFSHVHAKDRVSLADLDLLPAETRHRLAQDTHYPDIDVVDRRRSSDGFMKYLFQLSDGARVEAVRIPLPDPAVVRELKEKRRRGEVAGLSALPTAKYTVCLSSQVGCALACAFCATGKLGFSRNLATWEMLAQLRRIKAEADLPISGILFLGMGEPLLNYDAVIRTAKILSHPAGHAISADAISISTAGIAPAIHRYAEERHPYRLIVSLGAAESTLRARLMPIERTHDLARLREAIQAYAATTGGRITLAYVGVSGVNMGRDHAQALIQFCAGLRVKVNLIDVNDAEGAFSPPTEEEIRIFRDELSLARIPLARRYAGGKDIGAACGTLAATQRGGEVMPSDPG